MQFTNDHDDETNNDWFDRLHRQIERIISYNWSTLSSICCYVCIQITCCLLRVNVRGISCNTIDSIDQLYFDGITVDMVVWMETILMICCNIIEMSIRTYHRIMSTKFIFKCIMNGRFGLIGVDCDMLKCNVIILSWGDSLPRWWYVWLHYYCTMDHRLMYRSMFHCKRWLVCI